MGIGYNPSIVTSGLTLALDAGNTKSYTATNTNIFKFSEDFTNAAWVKVSVTVAASGITGPVVNGFTLPAYKIQETAVTNQFLVAQNPFSWAGGIGSISLAIGNTNTISVYAKAGERTQLTITSNAEGYAVFNLDTGTVYQTGGHVCTMESVGNGWYRCRATITETEVVSGSAWYIGSWKSNANVYLGIVGEGLYVTGAQFERASSTLGTYTKTLATFVSSLICKDLTGNGNDLSLINTPTYSGSNPSDFTFNGTNQYLTTSYQQPAQTAATSFTWVVWVYPLVNSDGPIIGCRNNSSVFTKLTSNKFEYSPLNVGGTMTLNVWQNITIVKNNTNFSYYKNGVLIATGVSSDTKTAIPFFVGGDNLASEYSNCKVSALQIYNRALTEDEVSQNFNAHRVRFGL
jgi:hypothetical protein